MAHYRPNSIKALFVTFRYASNLFTLYLLVTTRSPSRAKSLTELDTRRGASGVGIWSPPGPGTQFRSELGGDFISVAANG